MNGEKGTSSGMQIAGNIFNEMVMQEAIKDRTEQVEAEMNAKMEAEAQIQERNDADVDKDSDSDFNSDGDDAILMGLREQRLKQMKKKQKEEIENMQKGHGTYREITEEEFLPSVTKT